MNAELSPVAVVVQQVTIALVIASFLLTLVVIVSHYRVWRRSPSGSGIIPLHVVMVSISHLVFMSMAAGTVISRLDNPLNPFTFAFGFAGILTAAALYVVGRVQWRRQISKASR